MKLVIVESPSKAETIEKYLGGGFDVESSRGHIRDLTSQEEDLPSQYQNEEWAYLGVNVDDQFQPFYIITRDGSKKTIRSLKKVLSKADALYLATDEDREGEAISWHLKEVLDPSVPVYRMVFHEITKSAIQKALKSTRDIDPDLVDAQEARRILDRLVGFPLSHLVGEKIKFGLSAGRVQSVAVRLLAEKEKERRQYDKTIYWDLLASLQDSNSTDFEAELYSIDGKRVVQSKDFDSKTGKLKPNLDVYVLDEDQVSKLKKGLKGKDWTVQSIKENTYTSSPKPPFITSTLQRKASSKLGMSAGYTMSVAQDLYENGHITYHRTDSVNLSSQALKAARKAAYGLYGDDYVHDKTRTYSSKSSAQQAHEAIRPTGSTFTHPSKAGLSGKQYKLYKMIWQRTVACQMADAKKRSIRADLEIGDKKKVYFRAKGNRVDFAGYIGAYFMGKKNPEKLANQNNSFPELEEGENVQCDSIEMKEHETRPPSRYTESSLIKELEKEDIGRPSTYATIMSKITKDGKYARKEGKTMVPTFMGLAVTEFLKDYFPNLVDTEFTAKMEKSLDEIASGDRDKVSYLREFWSHFQNQLEDAREKAGTDAKEIHLDNFPAQMKVGYYGPYVEIEEHGETKTVDIPEDIPPADLEFETVKKRLEEQEKEPEYIGLDPDSGKKILVKDGQYGEYLQLGIHDEEENPDPKTASLPDEIEIDDLEPELAMNLFDLPREVGVHPKTGKPLETGIGPYGPFIRHAKESPEYESLDSVDQVFNLNEKQALEQLQKNLIQDLGEHPDSGEEIRIVKGKYGPYIKMESQNISIPDNLDPEEVSKEKVLELIEEG